MPRWRAIAVGVTWLITLFGPPAFWVRFAFWFEGIGILATMAVLAGTLLAALVVLMALAGNRRLDGLEFVCIGLSGLLGLIAWFLPGPEARTWLFNLAFLPQVAGIFSWFLLAPLSEAPGTERPDPLVCTQCGYNRSGLAVGSRCPECGTPDRSVSRRRRSPSHPRSDNTRS